ncbi:uncharacterized protein LOC106760339 [Vigna radiata var. radiata]|uniref:Uncharacterized protein LOC106760339 n=1 Tax=Vigna radiata var. radiata TaxID=3916 RepID=A0A1S3TZS0_VIGRR|nr:uncharacterized protein LOC106760339 [Vigna radiata var. radiata]
MTSRSPPPSPSSMDAPEPTRLMGSIITTMQQQNASLVQQNALSLQQLEAARFSTERTQEQYVELMSKDRTETRSSTLSDNCQQEWSLESFLQHHPAKFSGKCSPDEADQWFEDMERIFNAKKCSEENRLIYSEYLLTGEASHCVRFAKEVEFLELVQGNISVSDYATRFKHLRRFYTMETSEEWLCKKFENGLRGDIKLLIVGLCIREFPVLVERVRVSEKTKKEVESQHNQQPRVGEPRASKGSVSSRTTQHARLSPSKPKDQSSRALVPFGHSGQQGPVRCFNCGGAHLRSVCPKLAKYRKCK